MSIYQSKASIITRGSDTFKGISSTKQQGSRGILLGDDQKRHLCCVASACSECQSTKADIPRVID